MFHIRYLEFFSHKKAGPEGEMAWYGNSTPWKQVFSKDIVIKKINSGQQVTSRQESSGEDVLVI